MNPALLAALKKRNAKPKDAMPSVAQDASGTGPDHHAELHRHLKMGLEGSRRAAKVHLKMALHHFSNLKK